MTHQLGPGLESGVRDRGFEGSVHGVDTELRNRKTGDRNFYGVSHGCPSSGNKEPEAWMLALGNPDWWRQWRMRTERSLSFSVCLNGISHYHNGLYICKAT